MYIKSWKKELFTIPNMISIFRLLLIPTYVLIYLNAKTSTDYYLAAAILAISCLTDMIDGKIARRFNMISSIGKILDPLADKATQLTMIICLAIKQKVLWYLFGLFVIKESFQLIAGGINLRRGIMRKGALFSGKVCTAILFISLILMVMLPDLPSGIIATIVIINAISMMTAFVNYIIAYFFLDDVFQIIEE